MSGVTVRLVKPLKGRVISYAAEIVRRDAASIVVRAPWVGAGFDLGLLSFATGDTLIEHYYADRWYNVFELWGADGAFKGWYCNVTRPAVIGDDYVESEDLELDLIVAPDRAATRLDDEDEYAARGLERAEPAAHAAALAAVAELRALVARGAGPFAAGG